MSLRLSQLRRSCLVLHRRERYIACAPSWARRVSNQPLSRVKCEGIGAAGPQNGRSATAEPGWASLDEGHHPLRPVLCLQQRDHVVVEPSRRRPVSFVQGPLG